MDMNKILAVLCLILGVITTSSLWPKNRDSNGYVPNEAYDSVYAYAGLDLYNHDDIVTTEAFKKAALSEQQTLLLDAFKKRRLKASFAGYGVSIAYAVPTLALFAAAYRYRDRVAALPQGVSLGALLAFQNQLTGFVHEQYERLYKLISKMSFSSKKVSEKVIDYEILYVKNKHLMPANFQKIIEENLLDLRAEEHINLYEKTRCLEQLMMLIEFS